MIFQTCWIFLCQEVIGHASMKIKQYGISDILALDKHPLLQAVDLHEDLLRHAAGERGSVLLQEGPGFSGIAPGEKHAQDNEYQSEYDESDRQHDTPRLSCEGWFVGFNTLHMFHRLTAYPRGNQDSPIFGGVFTVRVDSMFQRLGITQC